MRNRNLLIGIGVIIGAFLLLGIAFRAGQASVIFGGFDDFDGRNGRFDREHRFESAEEFHQFMEENEEEFSDELYGERDKARNEQDRHGERGHGRDGRDGGRGYGRGYGRGGFGPGRIMGRIVGFLARIALLVGVVWVVLNWDSIQTWWNGRSSTVDAEAADDPLPPGKEIAVAGDTPANNDEPTGKGDEPEDGTNDG